MLSRSPREKGYAALQNWDEAPADVALDKLDAVPSATGPGGSSSDAQELEPGCDVPASAVSAEPRPRPKLPFGRIWTRNVVFTLVTTAFLDFHLGAFASLLALFLSTPRAGAPSSDGQHDRRRSLVEGLAGGLGMPAAQVGFATSLLGFLGTFLQLVLYPAVHARLGSLISFRVFLPFFPVAYVLAPYLAVLPSSTLPPAPAAGLLVWIGIVIVLLLQVVARTFAMPASIILLNNCSPHPSVLGTVHGLGQSVSAGFRTLGPMLGGWWYGAGLEAGRVDAGWWGVAAVAAVGCGSSMLLYEGDGHEIFLPGD